MRVPRDPAAWQDAFRRGTRVGLVTCALLAADPERLGGQPPATSEARDLRNLAGDVWSVWTSPAHIRRRDVIPVGAAISVVALSAMRDSVNWAWLSSHQDALAVRLLAPVRDGWVVPLNNLPTAPFLPLLSAATYAAGRLSKSAALADAGLGCAASHLGSLGLRVVAYHTIGRERPSRTPDPFHLSIPGGSGDWYMQSFTGGHVANATACGTFLAKRYSLGVAEPLPYVYAAAIGLGRMADGWHWTSDTMAGALTGYAVGSAIAHRQRAHAAQGQPGVGAARQTSIPVFRARIVF